MHPQLQPLRSLPPSSPCLCTSHIQVCPAGWKPGDATMKPDPKGSKEYFAAV